jgi:membrane-bound serine protease (ClpP class)
MRSILAVFLGFLLPIETSPAADSPAGPAAQPVIRLVEFEDNVNRVSAEWLIQSIDEADRDGDSIVLIRLDTPGGSLAALERITKRVLAARTPVVVWVAPTGAMAASAGFIMLIAADVAAMAPGTTTGSASPVTMSGEEKETSTAVKKMAEILAASARALAVQRGRNIEAAAKAVTGAAAYSATEALDLKLIDFIARDQDELLRRLDGWTARRPDGSTAVLRAAGARIVKTERSSLQKALGWLSNPLISYFLLMAGLAALYAELNNPGMIVPGAVGLICLLLFAYSSFLITVSIVGVLLILAALGLFALELKIASHGLLTLAGTVCLVIGSLMLYRGPTPEMRLSWTVVVPTSLLLAAACALAVRLTLKAHRARVTTGVEGMIGEVGEVTRDLAPEGKVFLHGEIWDAVAPSGAVARGARVRVVRVDGLRLAVEPVEPPAPR